MTPNGYLQGPPKAVHGLAGSREPIREQLACSFGVHNGAPDSALLFTFKLYPVAKQCKKPTFEVADSSKCQRQQQKPTRAQHLRS